MCEKQSIELNCNWVLAAGNNLNNILTISHESDKIVSSEDIIDVSRTVLLSDLNDSKVCELNVQSPMNLSLSSFNVILSGSKILEVFICNEEEYLGTFHGKYFDDFEGIFAYRYDVDIKRSKCRKVVLKFLNTNKDLWIYGMMLNVVQHDEDNILNDERNINFNNVQNILLNSNYKLTENAEKCKTFLQNYMSSKDNKNDPPNMQMLLSLFNSNNGNKEKNNVRNNSNENASEMLTSSNNDIKLMNKIKEYIDEKFSKLEIHINGRFDELEKRQNEKLDKIINILENKVNLQK